MECAAISFNLILAGAKVQNCSYKPPFDRASPSDHDLHQSHEELCGSAGLGGFGGRGHVMRLATLLVAVLAAKKYHAMDCGGGSPTAAPLKLQQLNVPAVCNDGTPGGYYWAPGSGAGVNTTLIYLAGGAWCYDRVSCAYRWNSTRDLMSSKAWPQTCAKTGIFDRNETLSPLHNVNKVYIGYCTSDAYMGDRSASVETYGWAFRGQRVVEEVIKDLRTRRNLLTRPDELLIFGGGSAGARGAMVWEERLRSLLPTSLPRLLYLDSPLWLDVEPYEPWAFAGFQAQTQMVLQLTNATLMLSKDCARAYKGQEWKCLYGEYRLPFLTTSYFLVASRYDSFQLSHDLETRPNMPALPPYTGELLAYASVFGDKTRRVLSGLPPAVPSAVATAGKDGLGASHALLLAPAERQARAPAWQTVYSGACYNHHISDVAGFWAVTTERNVSLSSGLRHYLAQPGSYRFVDTCEGFACGPGCGPLPSARGPVGLRPPRPHFRNTTR